MNTQEGDRPVRGNLDHVSWKMVFSQCIALVYIFKFSIIEAVKYISGNAMVLFAGSLRNVNQILCFVKLIKVKAQNKLFVI